MTRPAVSIGLVAEAPADCQTASELADRVICEAADWIDDSLEHHREWRGLEGSETHLEWHNLPALARRMGVRAHGHFGDVPGEPDAHAARLALLLFNAAFDCPEAVVLIRDSDGELQRGQGIARAIAASPWPYRVVVGLAHPKREAWVLSGFLPQDDVERRKLDEERRHLGFNPGENAHLLTATSPHAKRNAKDVLNRLTNSNPDREAACWRVPPIAPLKQRGQHNGLSAYLEDIEQKLIPLFTGRKTV